MAFNIGRDARLDIILGDGSRLAPTILTSFTAKQVTVDLKSRPLNDRVQHQIIPDGWEGTFEFDRADSTLDDFFAQSEDAYYNGTNAADIYITQTIKDPNTGAISTYRFFGVVMKFDDIGKFTEDGKIEQKVAFMASGRRKVS